MEDDAPDGEVQAPPFLSMPFFVSASPQALAASVDSEEETAPRQLTVVLHSGSDRSRDSRRLKRIHGMLRSFPGSDKFVFLVFEGGRRFLLEFPNDTTGICSDLIRRLIELVGEGNVSVEPIKLH